VNTTHFSGEQEDNQTRTLVHPLVEEVAYLRARLLEVDGGWRESYLNFQARATSEIDYLHNELRLALSKNVEQDRKYHEDKGRSDRVAFALGFIFGIGISTVAATFLLSLTW
jgi:hypothetical protein